MDLTDYYWRIRIWAKKQRMDDWEDIVAYSLVGAITVITAVLCCSCANRPARRPYIPNSSERDRAGTATVKSSNSVAPVTSKISQQPRATLPLEPPAPSGPNEDDPWY